MTSINTFDVNVYSDETYPVTESEYDEVMSLMADEASGFEGYAQWSDKQEVENFYVDSNGRVHHKPEPKSNGRLDGIEI